MPDFSFWVIWKNALPVIAGKYFLKTFTIIIDLISLKIHIYPKWGPLMHVYKRREPLSNGNKILTQKPKICLTISNRNAFSKASQKRTFLGKGSFMSEKTGCDSDQKPHFKTKYKYSRKRFFSSAACSTLWLGFCTNNFCVV